MRIEEILTEKCWKGYKKDGMKTMFGKRVTNCVKNEEVEDTLTLPKIKVGDEVMVGKFKNRKAEVKGFDKDDHNQPVLKTTKGDQKLFKPRISKLMVDETLDPILVENLIGKTLKWASTKGYDITKSMIQGWLKSAPPGASPADAADLITKGIATVGSGASAISQRKKNESITEAFDNPYSYYWDETYNGDSSFLAKAEMDMGELMVMFSVGEPGVSWTIDFAVDGSMDKTGDGDQFRIFATVVAVIKDWMANKVDLSKVTQIDFSSDKGGEAEDGRAKLYKRFGQQLASKLGWNLEITDRGQFASFKIKNPNAPVKEAVNEAKDGLPVKTLKGLYHVGTMDSSKKRDGFEGAGLSVSTHPDAWKQIARGHVTGDTHSATKEGNKFLDVHSLSDAHNTQIKQWAIKNGYLEQQETVTVCYYDDEMEDDLCSTFNSMADAEAEYDEELQHMDVTVDKGGIVPTDKLKKETRQNRIDSTGVLEFVLPIFAEQQGLDGVWWQDNLDVQRYSAPRGVIVPSKIKSWKFTVNESIAFNEEVEVSLHGDAKKGYVLSKIEVSGDERNAGQGTKAMQDIVDRMDREGAIIALTPDDAFGGNKNRLIKFYKRFGFVPNKGRNKDFRFRETMIRYPQSNESVNEVSKEEFDAIRNGYVDIEFDKKWWPLSSDYPLIKHIGEAIGATSWTSWGKVGVPWSKTEMIGGGGTYMLKGDFGHILLDASKTYRPDGITMAQISTSNRGGGVGVKVMNAIKSYADQKNLPFTVYKVTNKKFFDKFEWLTKTGVDTYEYNSSKNESITEAFDNPYPFELIGPNDSQEFSALAQTPNGMLRMDFEATDYDNFGIDFSVGKSMGKTDAGDEFKVFATVVAMMKKWIKTVGIEHVESFDFGANKGEHASDGRAKLYTRFAKQLASKLGWKLEQSTTGNNDTAFFKLTNPNPVPREQEYWDALDENVTHRIKARKK